MWWVVLGHLGVPFVFGVAFVVFATASGRDAPTWDIALETALDFALLGIGATGSIFENDTIEKVSVVMPLWWESQLLASTSCSARQSS